MHLLYCDESNLEERAGEFLIYGGLMVEAERALQLSTAIDRLLEKSGVPQDYLLKFNPGPKTFSHKQFIELKEAILRLAAEHGVQLLAYVILHDISSGPDTARRNGINTVCYHFHCALNRVGGPGLVLIDRFNDEGNEIDAHLREKFTIGLTEMPFAKKMRLPNILGFHYSAIGQSHFPSVMDVVLGSLRFAINVYSRDQKEFLGTANTLLSHLSQLFWKAGGKDTVSEIGFIFSPKTVKSDRYREVYKGLQDFLAENGIKTEQVITNQKIY